MRIRMGDFVLFKERAGVISDNDIWIIYHSCWMYADESLIKLLIKFIREYKLDKNLVG